MTEIFQKHIIENPENIFELLEETLEFEDIAHGRKGANIVMCEDHNMSIPIVRTTTIYSKPKQRMQFIHLNLIEKIRTQIGDANFNNALVEIYDPNYRTMRYHSDQALDLNPDSYICLFSCYENGYNNNDDLRTLTVKRKKVKDIDIQQQDYLPDEIILDHNSIVVFSVEDNARFIHKISLKNNKSKSRWLGITFRLSKTFVRFENNIPFFVSDGKQLTIANITERNHFLKCRGEENFNVGYIYPEMYYSLSIDDMIPVN
eukprot:gene13489-18099_t